MTKLHCGYVAIIGRPNVGKSTILNNFLQKKISITSNKPQTTQKQILAVKTTDSYQIIFVDTPGLHANLNKQQKNIITKYMMRAATQAIADVDLILFVISGTKLNSDDEFVLQSIRDSKIPCILLVNKVDLIKDKAELLPFIEKINTKNNFLDIFYISALKDKNLLNLENTIVNHLPQVNNLQEFFYENNYITNQSNKVLAAENIREKIMRFTNKEIPYDTAVEIEEFSESLTSSKKEILKIAAVIWVLREGQKVIILGKNGETIKQIGTTARLDLEKIFNKKVHLKLWVKVKSNWSTDAKILKNIGFEE